MRYLWTVAKRASKVFVVSAIVAYVLFYVVFGLGFVLSAVFTIAAASSLAYFSLEMATLPEELERAEQEAREKQGLREHLDEIRRQGPKRPRKPEL